MSIRDTAVALMLALVALTHADDPADPFTAALGERAKVKSSLDARIAAFEAAIQSEESSGRIDSETAKKERGRIAGFRSRLTSSNLPQAGLLPHFETQGPTSETLKKIL